MEKSKQPISGFLGLLLLAGCIAGFIFGIIIKNPIVVVLCILVFLLTLKSFLIVNPNGSNVLTFFGKYVGTVKKNGFHLINPLYARKKISLRARNLDSPPIKVNDSLGNPIMIGAVLVWRVKDTYKAAFEVDHYESFVNVQSEAAVRKLAGAYPYDNFEDDDMPDSTLTLRGGGSEVDEKLEEALRHRLDIAGVEVIEARISHLAYAQEIAGAMLQRQQATAIVAARKKIVEGAVLMVEDALQQLSDENIVELDMDQKANMVSNLMVVLCSDKSATPVINTGTYTKKMEQYIIIKKKVFERLESFEKKLNEKYSVGNRAVNIAMDQNTFAVLMERKNG